MSMEVEEEDIPEYETALEYLDENHYSEQMKSMIRKHDFWVFTF